MHENHFFILIYLLIHYFCGAIHADGASDPRFKYCLGICEGKPTSYLDSLLCANINPAELELYSPHFPMMDPFCIFFGWTRRDDCIYHCAHRLADREYFAKSEWRHVADSLEIKPTVTKTTFFENKAVVKQYYGKWPLFRVAGMQEFFSVLFSSFNLAAHCVGFGYFAKKTRMRETYRITFDDGDWCYFYWFPSILIYFCFACMTWLASMIYHVRQTPFTLGLDYFFSMGFLTLALAFTAVRVFRIKSLKKQAFLVYFPLVAFLIVYLILLFCEPDITKYHIYFGMIVSFFSVGLWLYWSIKYYRIGRRNPAQKKKHLPLILIFLFSLVFVTTSLGVFDFVPLGLLLDAHSLWHLSTVFLTILMYYFLTREAFDELARYNSSVFYHPRFNGADEDVIRSTAIPSQDQTSTRINIPRYKTSIRTSLEPSKESKETIIKH